jgi:hypothetical protein
LVANWASCCVFLTLTITLMTIRSWACDLSSLDIHHA